MDDKPQSTEHWEIHKETNLSNLCYGGIEKLVDFCRSNGGAHAIDVKVRRDGKDHWFQTDWIKYMEKNK